MFFYQSMFFKVFWKDGDIFLHREAPLLPHEIKTHFNGVFKQNGVAKNIPELTVRLAYVLPQCSETNILINHE